MKKIGVIFTGGTIGSQYNSEHIDIHKQGAYVLLERYKNDALCKDVEFFHAQPLNELSENLLPEQWLTMFNAIQNAVQKGCDGIILTHGTDTLPYTAAALSLMLGSSLKVPVVLVSADLPLENPLSNGYINFCAAVNLFHCAPLKGVFVPYFQNGEQYIHLGTRLAESLSFKDDFSSIGELWWGKMQNDKLVLNEQTGNVSLEAILNKPVLTLPKYSFCDNILFIKPYIGLNYGLNDFSKIKPAAIVHGVYHSGTACATTAQAHSAPAFVKRCNEAGIEVFMAPITRKAGLRYASTESIIAAGAIPLENISQEAALIKVMLAYGSITSQKDRIDYINSDVFFEHVNVNYELWCHF